MTKEYIKPEIEVMEINTEDVICTSGMTAESLNTYGAFAGSKSYNNLD